MTENDETVVHGGDQANEARPEGQAPATDRPEGVDRSEERTDTPTPAPEDGAEGSASPDADGEGDTDTEDDAGSSTDDGDRVEEEAEPEAERPENPERAQDAGASSGAIDC
jgi:hypothetical protein